MTIMCLVFLFGMALFPNLVTANNDARNTLTMYNAASSDSTLRTMLIIVLIGMPFVLTYTATVYWTFEAGSSWASQLPSTFPRAGHPAEFVC